MIFDGNAFIGEWPFRRLAHNTGEGLLRLMDRHGVDKAAVSSLFALFYKDCAVANRRLAEEIKGRGDRLIPVGTINPAFPGWEDDLKECVELLGAKAIKLFPAYQQADQHSIVVFQQAVPNLVELKFDQPNHKLFQEFFQILDILVEHKTGYCIFQLLHLVC